MVARTTGQYLLPQVADAGEKGYRRDTHRLIDPAETLVRVGRLAPAMGITRLANVTGLDTLGIPVVMSVRPNSRSLAVSQGKGLTLDAAKASALMESVEGYHAEKILASLKLASYEEMRFRHRVADIARLPLLAASRFHRDLPVLWIEGHDLVAAAPTWVPLELVTTDYTLPRPAGSGCFSATSNGLASGNHLLEATSHAISELIERDATTLWTYGGQPASRRRVDPDTIDDAGCRSVLDAYARGHIDVGIWETTTDVGIPAFLCMIVPDARADRDLYATSGMGCHPRREVALLRALTEAAQSRLTLISGSRDDNSSQSYEHLLDPDAVASSREHLATVTPCVDFRTAPTIDGETFAEDVTAEVNRLTAAGLEQVIVVDLSRPEFEIPVVRVVVPGLETPHDAPGFVLGARGHAVQAAVVGSSMKPIVFLGPSLPVAEAMQVLDALYLPPVRQGDVYRAALQHPPLIGIVDGLFERVPSVWHKEILWAMDQGIPVLGASSMGALRAAELDTFGMQGVGQVYEAFRAGELEDDDEVAIIHAAADDGYRPLSDAMVNLRRTFADALGSGIIDEDTHELLVMAAKSRHYVDRHLRTACTDALDAGADPHQIQQLRREFPVAIDQKRHDAVALLAVMAERIIEGHTSIETRFTFQYTGVWYEAQRSAGRLRLDVDDAGGRQGTTTHVTSDLILDELRLDPAQYRQFWDRTYARLSAVTLATMDGFTPDADDVRATTESFREQQGLTCPQEARQWLRSNDLTNDEVERLMHERAQFEWMKASSELMVSESIPDELRLAGVYREVTDRVSEKDRRLRAAGLDDASMEELGVTWDALLTWFFCDRLGRDRPTDLDAFVAANDFEDETHLRRVLLREWADEHRLRRPPVADAR